MIRVLDDAVINKIAAGEVVERPSSVLKELLENALDAGATDVRVELKQGGKALVRVSDDGSGMNAQDATLCLERHATSKIRSEVDLFQVRTLGFRGEALPSIAAVTRFELLTRPAGQDAGTRVAIEGGRMLDVRAAGCPKGTHISARNLFFNVPARRKFLRSDETELSHCLEAVLREILIRPGLDVEVVHDDEVILRAPRTADRASRAADVLGAHGEALIPVSVQRGNLEIEALVSPVGVHRGSPQGSSYLYVNGRFVKDTLLRRAVHEAYRGIVPKGRYPTVVLEVRVPPEHVDVNVHPAKTEVRFQFAHELEAAVAAGVREALHRVGIQRPVEVEARYRPREEAAPAGEQHSLPLAPPRPAPARPAPPPRERPLPETRAEPAEIVADSDKQVYDLPVFSAPPELPPLPEPALAPQADRLAEPTPSWDSGRALLPVPRFADLRVIGQLSRTYVLCEGGGELVIVDQHAAHERITLYRLMRAEALAGRGGQRLLTPVLVELSPARAAALAARVELLERVGLELEPFGGSTFAVKQIPDALSGADVARLVTDVADDLAEGGRGEPLDALREGVLATMACHSSVRAGQVLSPYEMRELLRALDEVDFSVCAHGRPVCIRVTAAELERRFHRA